MDNWSQQQLEKKWQGFGSRINQNNVIADCSSALQHISISLKDERLEILKNGVCFIYILLPVIFFLTNQNYKTFFLQLTTGKSNNMSTIFISQSDSNQVWVHHFIPKLNVIEHLVLGTKLTLCPHSGNWDNSGKSSAFIGICKQSSSLIHVYLWGTQRKDDRITARERSWEFLFTLVLPV